jgi:uncharacterized peroxidase-related enzyme
MPRITPIDPAHAPAAVAPQLDAVKRAAGFVPNFFRNAAVSPATLKGYLAFKDALGASSLPATTQEALALAVAESNRCDYCLSAHSAVAAGLPLDADERNRARRFESSDPKRAAALRFAKALLDAKGHVDDAAVAAVHAAGYTQAELLEIVSVVSINIFTNYLNDVSQLDIDFPRVRAGVPAVEAEAAVA